MPNLDPVTDLELAIHHAQTDDCRMHHALRLIDLKYELGHFPMIALMDNLTRRALAIELLRNMSATHNQESVK